MPAEYALVAAVFVNRLRQGMPLQTDPDRDLRADRRQGPARPRADSAPTCSVDHPYNTYRIAGLPPGPIANPGRAALAAAAGPGRRSTISTSSPTAAAATPSPRTLAEHNRNVAQLAQAAPASAGG